METTIQDPGLSWWCLFVQFLFLTPLKINMEHDHGQWRFGRSFSFLNGWFVGSMLIFQGVRWTFVFQYGSLCSGHMCLISLPSGHQSGFLDILGVFFKEHITVVSTKPVILAKLNPRLQTFVSLRWSFTDSFPWDENHQKCHHHLRSQSFSNHLNIRSSIRKSTCCRHLSGIISPNRSSVDSSIRIECLCQPPVGCKENPVATGGGNSKILDFYPHPWGDDPICRAYCSNGLVQPRTIGTTMG